MMVIVVTAVPAGLRGDLTKWLLQVSPGVFIGQHSARIRDQLWDRTCEEVKDGRALLVYSSDGEQQMRFRIHRHHWRPVDLDGLTLIKRPLSEGAKRPRRTGWSQTRAVSRSRNPSWRRDQRQSE